MGEVLIGKVSHYYDKIGVAVIELIGSIGNGDMIRFMGAATDFNQVIDSLQINREPVEKACAGQSIGLKTIEIVVRGDSVLKIQN